MTNAVKDSVATDMDPARLRKEVDDLIDTAVFLCRYWRRNGSIPTVPLQCLEDSAERCREARLGRPAGAAAVFCDAFTALCNAHNHAESGELCLPPAVVVAMAEAVNQMHGVIHRFGG